MLEPLKKALASQPAIDLVSKTKAVDPAGTFKVIISTSDEDRQGDTVDQTKWKLQNYDHPDSRKDAIYYRDHSPIAADAPSEKCLIRL
jgi:hypothetical protein